MAKQVLSDIISQCAIASNTIKITGTGTETKAQTFDKDKCLFIAGKMKEPVPEFNGEFGIDEKDLKLIKGLLGFTNYDADGSSMKVLSRKMGDEDVLDRIEFKGGGSKSVFNLKNREHVPTQANISSIPWEVEFELSAAKAAEVQKFASLFNDISPECSISTQDGDVIVAFGKPNSSVNSGHLTLATGIDGSLTGELMVPIDKFTSLLKLALAARSHKVMFSSSASLFGVEVETDIGVYNYYLRQNVRPE